MWNTNAGHDLLFGEVWCGVWSPIGAGTVAVELHRHELDEVNGWIVVYSAPFGYDGDKIFENFSDARAFYKKVKKYLEKRYLK